MRKGFIKSILALFLAWLPGLGCVQENGGIRVENLSPQEVKARLDSSRQIVLIDVRQQHEFTGPLGHIEGARLLPRHFLEDHVEELRAIEGKELVVYCRSGNRSSRAARSLAAKGIRVINMTGGMLRWNELGYPVVRNGKDNDRE